MRRHFAERHPELPLWSDADHRRSIRDMLDRRSAAARTIDGVFVFAYGSLIWNPCVEVAERRTARLHGYHRDFRLRIEMGRGTPETPGLMLALVGGGSCRGVALRLPSPNLSDELLLVWRREMLTGAYKPRWFMAPIHMSPEEAVLAHRDVQSQQSIAMHFGTFPMADDGMFEATEDLEIARKSNNISEEQFRILEEGDPLELTARKSADVA